MQDISLGNAVKSPYNVSQFKIFPHLRFIFSDAESVIFVKFSPYKDFLSLVFRFIVLWKCIK